MTVSNTSANSLLQSTAPARIRGQTVSLYMLVMRGGISVGSLLTGMSVHWLGVREALLINGAVALVAQGLIGGYWSMQMITEKILEEAGFEEVDVGPTHVYDSADIARMAGDLPATVEILETLDVEASIADLGGAVMSAFVRARKPTQSGHGRSHKIHGDPDRAQPGDRYLAAGER